MTPQIIAAVVALMILGQSSATPQTSVLEFRGIVEVSAGAAVLTPGQYVALVSVSKKPAGIDVGFMVELGTTLPPPMSYQGDGVVLSEATKLIVRPTKGQGWTFVVGTGPVPAKLPSGTYQATKIQQYRMAKPVLHKDLVDQLLRKK